MKKITALALFAFSLCLGPLIAGTVNIPKEKPVATVHIPEKWTVTEVDRGIGFESPDQVATIFVEVASAKGIDALIDENVDWLTKEQDVKIDEATQKDGEAEFSGRKWSKISWDGSSKEWGPSVVGFFFTDIGHDKILTITYWITKKDSEKQMGTLDNIFDTLKVL